MVEFCIGVLGMTRCKSLGERMIHSASTTGVPLERAKPWSFARVRAPRSFALCVNVDCSGAILAAITFISARYETPRARGNARSRHVGGCDKTANLSKNEREIGGRVGEM